MNVADIDVLTYRAPSAPGVDSQFVSRWSPRAMSAQPVTTDELDILFEAARWAPSCFNAQPWVFLYAHRNHPGWRLFFDALVEGNQSWVASAGALIAVTSRTRFEHNDKPADTHSFDAGAAWMSIALQAQRIGLITHAMRGFDRELARENLRIPEVFHLDAMIAVGRPGLTELLSESQREREFPSTRKDISACVHEGTFPSD